MKDYSDIIIVMLIAFCAFIFVGSRIISVESKATANRKVIEHIVATMGRLHD